MSRFIKVGDGQTEVQQYSANISWQNSGYKMIMVNVNSIASVSKTTKGMGTVAEYLIQMNSPNLKNLKFMTTDKEYEAYFDNALNSSHEPDNPNDLAAVKSHLETLLVMTGNRRMDDEPLF